MAKTNIKHIVARSAALASFLFVQESLAKFLAADGSADSHEVDDVVAENDQLEQELQDLMAAVGTAQEDVDDARNKLAGKTQELVTLNGEEQTANMIEGLQRQALVDCRERTNQECNHAMHGRNDTMARRNKQCDHLNWCCDRLRNAKAQAFAAGATGFVSEIFSERCLVGMQNDINEARDKLADRDKSVERQDANVERVQATAARQLEAARNKHNASYRDISPKREAVAKKRGEIRDAEARVRTCEAAKSSAQVALQSKQSEASQARALHVTRLGERTAEAEAARADAQRLQEEAEALAQQAEENERQEREKREEAERKLQEIAARAEAEAERLALLNDHYKVAEWLRPFKDVRLDDGAPNPVLIPQEISLGLGENDENLFSFLRNHKKNIFNIGLIGVAGSGKSGLNNALRGWENTPEDLIPADQCAPSGVIEMHRDGNPKRYQFSDTRGICGGSACVIQLWDLPGIGTKTRPTETYFMDVSLKHFDFLVHVTSERWREDDLILEAEFARQGIKSALVRSHRDKLAKGLRTRDMKELGITTLAQLEEHVKNDMRAQMAESTPPIEATTDNMYIVESKPYDEMGTKGVGDLLKVRSAILDNVELVWSQRVAEMKRLLETGN